MQGTIQVITSKYRLIVVGPQHCLWYKNGRIYVSNDPNCNDLHLVNDLWGEERVHVKNSLILKSKIAQRIFRLEPRCCVKVGEGLYCFAYNHKIYIISENGDIINSTCVRKEMRNPLQIVSIIGIKGFQDAIYYGEYGWNDERRSVNIMQFDGQRWKPVYTFQNNTICHIHALIPDKDNNCIYILTGDKDNESGIWKATEGFLNVDPIFLGKQSYRTCAGFCNGSKLIYATDTPLEKNYIYSTDLRTQPEVICELPGSVINSMQRKDEWWFATAVEQDPSLPKLIHYFSVKRGPGILDNYSHLYRMNSVGEVREVLRFKKDLLPMWMFQFGNISFINNYRDNRVFIYPIAVKKYNQMTLEIKVK